MNNNTVIPLPPLDIYGELERIAGAWDAQVNNDPGDDDHIKEAIDAFGQLARLACSSVLR